jgi:hypothetical protein
MIYVLIEQHHHWIIKYIGLYPCLLVADEDWSVLRVLWKSRKAQLYPFSALSAFKCNESWTISCQWVSCCLLRVSMVFPAGLASKLSVYLTLLRHCKTAAVSTVHSHCDRGVSQAVSVGKQPWDPCKRCLLFACLGHKLPMLLKPS